MTLHGRRVLVVEDAPDVLDVLTMLLRMEAADVTGAANGRDALAAFQSGCFDVVVTDLGLPDMPGEVLIRALIAGAAGRSITIVVITGESESAIRRARKAGAAAIFTKPCAWEGVLAYLAHISLAPAA